MLHLRVIVPREKSDAVRRLLEAEAGVTHLVVWPGAAVSPPGDVMSCDVAREAANTVLEDLRHLGIDDDGAIVLEDLDVVLSRSAREAELAAPGEGADAVVWEQITEVTSEESTISVTFLAFLTLATMIAACGVLLDNPILIVGAMVVGPEFGPLAGLCVAVVQRRPRLAARSAFALLAGFPIAMALTMVFTWLLTWSGEFEKAMLEAERPLTAFIYQPDWLSFWVAFLAGIAGMMSLTSSKSGALIGVLISVTTVPAAANTAVAIAYGDLEQAAGSLGQLLLNLCAIVLSGSLTLLGQRLYWNRTHGSRSRHETLAASRPPAQRWPQAGRTKD
ncbi:DUF389 domain-containing protein [Yinghuangia soli]|uniref:DUF389 domain-containing protein n=1 Tax=Yinghuangia soli TaxID=2908204 RepID=A0AA41U1Y7_9ACTN|nr:DUF389 domain-containing protein [Yinghuangia soli]MCF2530115.1 DUF389 domain-containing protein [Yinghuangia soli]